MPIPSAKLRVGEFPKKLTLTPESKALLERGAAGQGYVYFIEMKNGNIHCLPAVNVEKNEIKKTNQTLSQLEKKSQQDMSDRVKELTKEIFQLEEDQQKLSEEYDQVENKELPKSKLEAIEKTFQELDSKIHSKIQFKKEIEAKLRQLEYQNQVSSRQSTPEVKVLDKYHQPFEDVVMTDAPKSSQAGSAGGTGAQLHNEGQRRLGLVGEIVLAGGFWVDGQGGFQEIRTRATANMMNAIYNPLFMIYFKDELKTHAVGHSQVVVREISNHYVKSVVNALYNGNVPQGIFTATMSEKDSPIPKSTRGHLHIEENWASEYFNWFLEYFEEKLDKKKTLQQLQIKLQKIQNTITKIDRLIKNDMNHLSGEEQKLVARKNKLLKSQKLLENHNKNILENMDKDIIMPEVQLILEGLTHPDFIEENIELRGLALGMVCRRPHLVEVTKTLLKYKIKQFDLDESLLAAIETNNFEIINLLLEKGAVLDIKEALKTSLEAKDEKIIHWLVSNPIYQVPVNQILFEMMQNAIKKNSMNKLQMLLEIISHYPMTLQKIFQLTNEDGDSLLSLATNYHSVEQVALLLERGAGGNVKEKIQVFNEQIKIKEQTIQEIQNHSKKIPQPLNSPLNASFLSEYHAIVAAAQEKKSVWVEILDVGLQKMMQLNKNAHPDQFLEIIHKTMIEIEKKEHLNKGKNLLRKKATSPEKMCLQTMLLKSEASVSQNREQWEYYARQLENLNQSIVQLNGEIRGIRVKMRELQNSVLPTFSDSHSTMWNTAPSIADEKKSESHLSLSRKGKDD